MSWVSRRPWSLSHQAVRVVRAVFLLLPRLELPQDRPVCTHAVRRNVQGGTAQCPPRAMHAIWTQGQSIARGLRRELILLYHDAAENCQSVHRHAVTCVRSILLDAGTA